MERQLHLLAHETGGDVPLGSVPNRKAQRPISAKNRAVGRRGLVQARAALAAALRVPEQMAQQLVQPSSTNARRRPAA